jgi:plastocyanin
MRHGIPGRFVGVDSREKEAILMSFARFFLVLLSAAALTLGLVACGDDDDGEGNGGTATATTPPAQDDGETPVATTSAPQDNDETPPAAGGGTTVDVTAQNTAFSPDQITVPSGEPVTFRFTNEDSIPHTFTLYTDEAFEQPISGGNADAEQPQITIAFVAPGEYYFRCEVHPDQMQGTVTAQ